MKAKLWIGVIMTAVLLSGCGNRSASGNRQNAVEDDQAGIEGAEAGTAAQSDKTQETQSKDQEPTEYIEVGTTVTELESGFSVVRFEGNDGFWCFSGTGWSGVRPGSAAVFDRYDDWKRRRSFF